MTELERIKTYIDQTPIKDEATYYLHCGELRTLCPPPVLYDSVSQIGLAFRYGVARGYRAAKAEVQV